MSDQPTTLLTALHLHQAAAVLPGWLERAANQELGYADFLQGLLEEEFTARTAAETQRRLRQAAFPFAATIEQFDFRFRPELKRQIVLRYLDPTFVAQAGTLTLVGPPGLGKTTPPECLDFPGCRAHRDRRGHGPGPSSLRVDLAARHAGGPP